MFSIIHYFILRIYFISGKPKLFLIQACRGQQTQESVTVSDGSKIGKPVGQVGRLVELYEKKQSTSSNITRHQSESAGSSEVLCVDAHVCLPKQTPIDADMIVQYATTTGKLYIVFSLGLHFRLTDPLNTARLGVFWRCFFKNRFSILPGHDLILSNFSEG